MKKNKVVFVGFQEQDNLGIGYIASVLLDAGYGIHIADFRIGETLIFETIKRFSPIAVGFSVIFQHHLEQFRDLVVYLRENGVSCHFSAGGHYPSLRPGDLLNVIPQLDSVVLFEGERTFLELVNALASGQDWNGIPGIAFASDGKTHMNPLRPLEIDLDNFPPPVRPPLKEYALGRKFATLLAGRGCIHQCSFCSIHEFYSKPPGPVKRIRRPDKVVREMELLHYEQSCSVFLFQDDDFPLSHKTGKKWAVEFCKELTRAGLNDKILWKANCRPDEIDREMFLFLKEHGLFLVYLGIESGTESGLKLMDKRIDASTNLDGVTILKNLGILYDYGFMLFDPESTIETVRENLSFLEKLCGDGSSPVTFCKMLPYAETKIERRLQSQGRLKGTDSFRDYDFHTRELDHLYVAMATCFADWIGEHDGLLNLARWIRYHFAVYEKFYPVRSPCTGLWNETRDLIAASNRYFVHTALKLADSIHSSDPAESVGFINETSREVDIRHREYCRSLLDTFTLLDEMGREQHRNSPCISPA